jgi:hypothetical protein
MGMDQTVTFPGREAPAWPAVAALLAERSYPVQMRMIDGELAFPDEEPPPGWQEIRLGTPQGMVTLRRQRQGPDEAIVLVTWGNADADLRQAWNALTWACALAGAGQIHTEAGTLDAQAFAQQVELPPGFSAVT